MYGHVYKDNIGSTVVETHIAWNREQERKKGDYIRVQEDTCDSLGFLGTILYTQ